MNFSDCTYLHLSNNTTTNNSILSKTEIIKILICKNNFTKSHLVNRLYLHYYLRYPPNEPWKEIKRKLIGFKRSPKVLSQTTGHFLLPKTNICFVFKFA